MHMRQALFLLSELIEKYTYMFLFHPSPHLLNYLHIPPQSSHSFPQVTPRLFILAPGVCFATASSYLACQIKALWSWFNTQHDSGTKRETTSCSFAPCSEVAVPSLTSAMLEEHSLLSVLVQTMVQALAQFSFFCMRMQKDSSVLELKISAPLDSSSVSIQQV